MVTAKKTAAPKRRGLGLHIGLNFVDPKQYEGWDGELAACENDARDMAALSKARGLTPTVLLRGEATVKAVVKRVRAAAKALSSGDLFFLTFSGHGGQVDDTNGDEGADRQDETWCLFDRQWIDDELYYELAQFQAGVRIVMLSDSCHSGTVARAAPPKVPSGKRSKMLPPQLARQIGAAHADLYRRAQAAVAKAVQESRATDPDAMLAQVAVSGPSVPVAGAFRASLVLISGCQDNQTSLDGDKNGAFTEALLRVWSGGSFQGNYADLHKRVRARLPPSQTPNLFTLGAPAAVGRLLAQSPFTI